VAFLAESDDTREKSAFTKYNNKERKNVPENNISKEDNGIDTSASNLRTSNSIPPNINMMQFPALRKLLDITGGGASQFKSSTMTIPSLAVPPAPHQVNVAGSMIPPTLALGLGASNTCAKCGVTFRMTSDLVYHMRTHHSKLTNTRYYEKNQISIRKYHFE